MARSLLISSPRAQARGSPVVRVTSEVSVSTSFQSAAAKSARPDAESSAGKDNFATLVDSNTAASNDSRPQDNAPRRSDDTPAASDNRSRDNSAASDRADKAARNDASDRNTAANARNDKARDDNKDDVKADTDGKTDTDT